MRQHFFSQRAGKAIENKKSTTPVKNRVERCPLQKALYNVGRATRPLTTTARKLLKLLRGRGFRWIVTFRAFYSIVPTTSCASKVFKTDKASAWSSSSARGTGLVSAGSGGASIAGSPKCTMLWDTMHLDLLLERGVNVDVHHLENAQQPASQPASTSQPRFFVDTGGLKTNPKRCT